MNLLYDKKLDYKPFIVRDRLNLSKIFVRIFEFLEWYRINNANPKLK